MLKKVLDYILFGLNKVLMCFAYMFKYVGLFFKTCANGISKGFIFLGSYIDKFYQKCILPVWKKIVGLFNKVKELFNKLGVFLDKKREAYREKTKDNKTVRLFIFIP